MKNTNTIPELTISESATPAEILRAAVARARQVPEGFDMTFWVQEADTPCGTAGCLAYEICAVTGNLGTRHEIADRAASLIGLDEPPALFHLENWPPEFRERYDEATTPDERVDALEAVVEAWITGTLYGDESAESAAGNVFLRGYQHPLPASLQSIGGYLYVRGYQHPLPASLQSIGGYLYVEGYQHPLPASLQVKGKVVR